MLHIFLSILSYVNVQSQQSFVLS